MVACSCFTGACMRAPGRKWNICAVSGLQAFLFASQHVYLLEADGILCYHYLAGIVATGGPCAPCAAAQTHFSSRRRGALGQVMRTFLEFCWGGRDVGSPDLKAALQLKLFLLLMGAHLRPFLSRRLATARA